jgi:hypothetical protein
MLSTALEYLCTEPECYVQGWNSFYRVGIPLYRVGMHSTGVQCFLKGSDAFDRVGMLSTDLEYLCTELECFLQG